MADIFHKSLHVAITFFTFLSLRVAITFVTFLSLRVAIRSSQDTRENRIRWFVHCLNQLKALNIKSVGLPYQIGCGLGGGDWTAYFEIIQEFARESNIDFLIVRPSFVRA
jgi:hypothetical protein